MTSSDLHGQLRHPPRQARSRARVLTVLDGADALLASEGAEGFTAARVAREAGIPVGSVYHYFLDKEAIIEALALRYWSDFEDLVAGLAEADERQGLPEPAGAVLDALAAGFRGRPGFLALWFGGLRTERVRDVTRPTRTAIAASISRILAVHWPRADSGLRRTVAQMLVVTGDGLLREAFRHSSDGDEWILREGRMMLNAYMTARLGPVQQ